MTASGVKIFVRIKRNFIMGVFVLNGARSYSLYGCSAGTTAETLLYPEFCNSHVHYDITPL